MAFGQSQLNFIGNTPETIAQIVQTSLLLWLGEWYLDVTAGMPWIQGVLGKHNQATADVTVQDYISNIQGVTDIDEFESVSQQDVRLYKAAATLDTIYGPTPIDVANSTLF